MMVFYVMFFFLIFKIENIELISYLKNVYSSNFLHFEKTIALFDP